MKRLLMILLVLGLSVPAIADVFVYNIKLSGVYFENEDEGWVKSKPSGTSYLVIQKNDGSDSINIWVIETWKDQQEDEDTDKMTTVKFYSVDGPSNISFLETLVSKKNTWLAEGDLVDYKHIMLWGQTKSANINSTQYTVAGSLSGYLVCGDISDDEVGGYTVSLKLNATITKVLMDGEADLANAIVDYFESTLGYEQGF
jgi:hypothetical protein